MNSESFQNTLFEDPIGLRFRHARELAKLSVENVATKLRLPVAVLEAIEREDWGRLGAPIFVRSYVGSYARLLGLPESLADEVVRGKAAPQLAPIGSDAPRRGAFDRGVMNLAYLAMTVLIVGSVVMLAMYFQGARRTSEVLPLDPPAAFAIDPTPTEPLADSSSASPVMASLAPSMTPAAAQLTLDFRGASWLEVDAPDGTLLERGTIDPGATRSFDAARIGKITLGDAAAVQVKVDGIAMDLAPFREARLARFAVSSRGELLPVPRD